MPDGFKINTTSVSVNSTGLVTVVGMNLGATATIKVGNNRSGYSWGVVLLQVHPWV